MIGKVIIDASNARLGRLASHASKQALLGNEVVIVNCNAAVITGNKRTTIEDYKVSRQRGGSSLNGPHFPQSSERLVKRTIRGMLSYKQGRGLSAFKRIKCYSGMPSEYEGKAKPFAAQKPTLSKTIGLGELSKEI